MIPFITSSVVIVDDHSGFRAIAREMLEKMGLDVLGEADSGESAMDMVLELNPDIVLLDIQLPGMDGIEVARRLQGVGSSPLILLTSTREASDYGRRLEVVPTAVFVAKGDLSPDSFRRATMRTS